MNINITIHDHVIRIAKSYISITQDPEYCCTFIKDTNIPDAILERLFGDVREGKFSKYLPYLIKTISISSEGIIIYGEGRYSAHKNIIPFKK